MVITGELSGNGSTQLTKTTGPKPRKQAVESDPRSIDLLPPVAHYAICFAFVSFDNISPLPIGGIQLCMG